MRMLSTERHRYPPLSRPTSGSLVTDWCYTRAGKLLVPEWQSWYGTLDWEHAAAKHRNAALNYPTYYLCDRHGVKGGYMNGWQAVGWSFAAKLFGMQAHYQYVARYLSLRHHYYPHARLLDIGTGTGDWIIQVGQQLPQLHVTALDLSPYMLAAAERRWELANLPSDCVTWVHGNGEALPFGDASHQIITCFLLLHELTPAATEQMLREARRVLVPGGRLVLFDAVQRPLPLRPLNDMGVLAIASILQEPDFATYAAIDLATLAQAVGFRNTSTTYLGRLPWQFHLTEAW